MTKSQATFPTVIIVAAICMGLMFWAVKSTLPPSFGRGLQVCVEAPPDDHQSLVDIIPGPGGGQLRILRRSLFNSSDVASAHVGQSADGTRQVVIVWTSAAADRFEQLTSANINRHIAIFLDGQLLSTPTIKSPVRDAMPIDYGRNGFSLEQANQIVAHFPAAPQ